MEIKKMGVVGAGQMGSGIAEVALVSGLNVLMRDVTIEADRRIRSRSSLFQRFQGLSLSVQSRADGQHDGDAGDGRCAGDGGVAGARVQAK